MQTQTRGGKKDTTVPPDQRISKQTHNRTKFKNTCVRHSK